MRSRLMLALVLLLPVAAVAQIEVVGGTGGTRAHAQSVATGTAAPEFPFPGGFKPPDGFFDEFWKDPAIADQLHLSDEQRKQLQDAALTQRLALIDSGAEAFKAFLKLSAALDAEPYDDAAYNRQLSELAAATGKAVQNVGEMAAAPRRILTTEQWAKLQSIKRAKKAAAAAAKAVPKTAPQPRIPPSLQQPMER